jgi:hypothetical protein
MKAKLAAFIKTEVEKIFNEINKVTDERFSIEARRYWAYSCISRSILISDMSIKMGIIQDIDVVGEVMRRIPTRYRGSVCP